MFGFVYLGAYGFGAIPSGTTPDDAVAAPGRRKGKYKHDHADALLAVQNVRDFAEDHAGVLVDVTDAGV